MTDNEVIFDDSFNELFLRDFVTGMLAAVRMAWRRASNISLPCPSIAECVSSNGTLFLPEGSLVGDLIAIGLCIRIPFIRDVCMRIVWINGPVLKDKGVTTREYRKSGAYGNPSTPFFLPVIDLFVLESNSMFNKKSAIIFAVGLYLVAREADVFKRTTKQKIISLREITTGISSMCTSSLRKWL